MRSRVYSCGYVSGPQTQRIFGSKNEARHGSLLRASHQAGQFWGPVLGPVLEPVLEPRFGAIPGLGWEL